MNFNTKNCTGARSLVYKSSVFLVWLLYFLIFIFFDLSSALRIVVGSSIFLFLLSSNLPGLDAGPLKEDVLTFWYGSIVLRYILFVFPLFILIVFDVYEGSINYLEDFLGVDINDMVREFNRPISDKNIESLYFFDVISTNNFLLFSFSVSFFFSSIYGFGFYFRKYVDLMKKYDQSVRNERVGMTPMRVISTIPCFFIMAFVCYIFPYVALTDSHFLYSSVLLICITQVFVWSFSFLFLQSLVFNVVCKIVFFIKS